ncbi:hypothetical protein AB4254_11245 [Vibrio breoganii]
MMNNKTSQLGTTLLELVLVLGVMGVISTTLIKDRLNALTQAQATNLGMEIAIFANGLASYTKEFAGLSPILNPSAPSDGDIFTGVNWLKSVDCDLAETTSTGLSVKGFINDCRFLSNTDVVDYDEKTSFGELEFTTTFTRELGFEGGDSRLVATAYLDMFVPDDVTFDINGVPDLVMTKESGIAALVASGMSVSSNIANSDNYSVIFCIPSMAAVDNALWNQLCLGHDWQIAITTAHDSSTSPWLRTDGGNFMNNLVTFNPTINEDVRALANITNILLTDTAGDYTGMEGSLAIGQDPAAPFIRMNGDNIDILRSNLSLQDAELRLEGNSTLKVEFGDINIKTGDLITNNTDIDVNYGQVRADSIVATDRMRADYFVDLTGGANNYHMRPDQDSEFNNLGVQGLYFGDTVGARANNNVPSITSNSTTEINISADNINHTPNSATGGGQLNRTEWEGTFDLRDFNILNSSGNGSIPITSALPRYTHLGSTVVQNTTTINKSTFSALGCLQTNLKILVTPTHVYQNLSINASTSASGGNGWRSLVPLIGANSIGYSIYASNRLDGIGHFNTEIVDNGASWTARIISRETSKGAISATRYGRGIANVYCLNEIAR